MDTLSLKIYKATKDFTTMQWDEFTTEILLLVKDSPYKRSNPNQNDDYDDDTNVYNNLSDLLVHDLDEIYTRFLLDRIAPMPVDRELCMSILFMLYSYSYGLDRLWACELLQPYAKLKQNDNGFYWLYEFDDRGKTYLELPLYNNILLPIFPKQQDLYAPIHKIESLACVLTNLKNMNAWTEFCAVAEYFELTNEQLNTFKTKLTIYKDQYVNGKWYEQDPIIANTTTATPPPEPQNVMEYE